MKDTRFSCMILDLLAFKNRGSLLSRAVAAERAQGKARAGVPLPLGAWSPGDVGMPRAPLVNVFARLAHSGSPARRVLLLHHVPAVAARLIMGHGRAAPAATARTWRVADALLRDSECDELEADMHAFEAALRAVAADVVAVPVAAVPLIVSVAAGSGRVVDKEAAGRTKAASALIQPARVETGATAGSADRENEAQSAARGEKIRAAARLDFAVVCDFAALSVGVMELFR
jgi:hypothetical protein